MRISYKPALFLFLLSLAPVAEPLALAHECGNQSADTVSGAVVGGLLGALLGGKHNRLAGALIGGAAGALIGNSVGREVDEADRCDFGNAYNSALEHNNAGYSESWVGPRGHGEVRIIQSGYAREDRTECRQWGSTYYDSYGRVHQESGYVCRTESTWVARDQVVWADADTGEVTRVDEDRDSSSRFVNDYEVRGLIDQLRHSYSNRRQYDIVSRFSHDLMERNQFIRDSAREDILDMVNDEVRSDVRDLLMRISR